MEKILEKVKIAGIMSKRIQFKNVTMDDKCDIDTEGECITKEGQTFNIYGKYDFNSDGSDWKSRNLFYFEMPLDKCSQCRRSPEDATYRKRENEILCKDVEINSNCKVEDGQLKINQMKKIKIKAYTILPKLDSFIMKLMKNVNY